MSVLAAQPTKIGFKDLPEHWRVDVQPGWRGLEMHRTFVAQLFHRPGRNWVPLGHPVNNDDGPGGAIADLLAILDLGEMPL